MNKSDKLIDIVKEAILLEIKGKTFYENVASQTKNPGISKIFNIMAQEEKLHIDILSKKFNELIKKGKFSNDLFKQDSPKLSDLILSEETKKSISAASYESSAITAAMALEQRAVNFYSQRAATSTDTDEKAIFEYLANWEKTHLSMLAELDKYIMENIWFDNKFWPTI